LKQIEKLPTKFRVTLLALASFVRAVASRWWWIQVSFQRKCLNLFLLTSLLLINYIFGKNYFIAFFNIFNGYCVNKRSLKERKKTKNYDYIMGLLAKPFSRRSFLVKLCKPKA